MPDLPSFDLCEFAGRLGARLHGAGVPVTAERAAGFVEILHLLAPVDRYHLYWAARLAFVSGRDQVEAFDTVFAAVFAAGGAPPPPGAGSAGPSMLPPLPMARRLGTQPNAPWSRLSAGGRLAGGPCCRGDDASREEAAVPTLASADEALATKDFGEVADEERAALRRLLAALVVATPDRRRRRSQPHRRGRRIDLRRTLRDSHRFGGDPARLVRHRPTVRPRPLVVLCDISGSMEPYTRAYLQFFCTAARGVHAETFVFATRLTRLSALLRHASPDVALARAGATAPDWSGGTRIGASLATFNRRYGRPGMARGAVVVIFSDGWERDDPADLAQEMARLSRLAFRVVWVNPRKAAPGYEPLAGGMAAALPFVDSFVSGHSVAALGDVVAAIGGDAMR